VRIRGEKLGERPRIRRATEKGKKKKKKNKHQRKRSKKLRSRWRFPVKNQLKGGDVRQVSKKGKGYRHAARCSERGGGPGGNNEKEAYSLQLKRRERRAGKDQTVVREQTCAIRGEEAAGKRATRQERKQTKQVDRHGLRTGS